jgi:hypothetical protein
MQWPGRPRPTGELWAWVGAVAAPVLGLAVALPAHYPNHFDTLGHLGLIYPATVVFIAGALRGIIAQHRGRLPEGQVVGGRDPRMQAPATLLCAKCGEAADGWKCAICGSVAREHDPGHLHVAPTATARRGAPAATRPTSTAPASSQDSGFPRPGISRTSPESKPIVRDAESLEGRHT